jgi:hypothetical protein
MELMSRYSDGLQAGRPGFHSRQRQKSFLFSTLSTPPLEPTHQSIKRVPGALSPRVKRLERAADSLSPSSAEVKNAETI